MLYVLTTQNWKNVSWSLTFKMAAKIWAWKPEVDENASFSMVDIVMNYNHR